MTFFFQKKIDLVRFHKELISWYMLNKRELPWRFTKDPYLIWLSEIILQQTKVSQGLSYYDSFSKTYPNVNLLADANQQDILNMWRGLGYYSRAINLHNTAKFIKSNYDGVFPDNYNDIIELKGVGDYTASAIASFAFDLPHAVLDGNVFRFLSRLFDISEPINSSNGKKQFGLLSKALLYKKDPATYNQAIMEFGALNCTPVNPSCNNCVLNFTCLSYKKDNVKERPVKIKKIKIKQRFFMFFINIENEFITIEQRTQKDIWKNLYQFPMIEFKDKTLFDSAIKEQKKRNVYLSKIITHKLTHQKIDSVFVINHNYVMPVLKNQKKIKINNLSDFPMPRLLDVFLENNEQKIIGIN